MKEEVKRLKEEIAEEEKQIEKLQDRIAPTVEEIDYRNDRLSDLRGELEALVEAAERDRHNQGGD